jgi:hypothetical protein
MKTAKLALALSLLSAQASLADTTPSPTPSPSPSATPSCQILRTAKAKVYVTKLSYTQVNGTWTSTNELICSTTADVNVVSQQAPGCSYTPIITCNPILDGAYHSLTISSLIYFYTPAAVTPNNPPLKEFGVAYYIDRNNGENGFSSSTSQNLSLAEAGVNMDTSRDMTASGTSFNDSLNLNVTFEDTNAAQ